MNITHVTFESYDLTKDSFLQFAVVMAKYKNKWVFVKHRQRTTYEIPGGRREKNEPILVTAQRELYEETGAKECALEPIDVYNVHFENGLITSGLLCYGLIEQFEQLPESEIEKVILLDAMPENLTYPAIQPHLFKRVCIYLDGE